jgi:hypothetical protein
MVVALDASGRPPTLLSDGIDDQMVEFSEDCPEQCWRRKKGGNRNPMQARAENNQRMPNDVVEWQAILRMDERPKRVRCPSGEQQKQHRAWEVRSEGATHTKYHPTHNEIEREQQPFAPAGKRKLHGDSDRGWS